MVNKIETKKVALKHPLLPYMVCVVLMTMLSIVNSQAQAQTEKRLKQFNIEDKIAIQGYDPVSYFTKGKATKGNKSFAYTYEGVIYYFANASNKEAFVKSPQKYEPQYGGWCAYAMGAKGEKVEVDPETFKILDGKLYLFYHSFLNNTLNSWNENEKNLKVKADANWRKFFN